MTILTAKIVDPFTGEVIEYTPLQAEIKVCLECGEEHEEHGDFCQMCKEQADADAMHYGEGE